MIYLYNIIPRLEIKYSEKLKIKMDNNVKINHFD